jgi:hypothetical protein
MIISSSTGGRNFTEGGNIYNFDRTSGERERWRCKLRRRYNCRATLYTNIGSDIIVQRVNQHSHGSNAAHVEVICLQNALRSRAGRWQDNATALIVSTAIEVGTSQAAIAITRQANLKRLIQRKRVAERAAPRNPASLADLVIPIGYQMYASAEGVMENWLKFDSGAGVDRLLVFALTTNLNHMAGALEVFMDGTFKRAPPLFMQLYTIHSVVNGSLQPMVWALLPNKEQATYDRLFRAISQLRPNFDPHAVMSDFELAATNAFVSVS